MKRLIHLTVWTDLDENALRRLVESVLPAGSRIEHSESGYTEEKLAAMRENFGPHPKKES